LGLTLWIFLIKNHFVFLFSFFDSRLAWNLLFIPEWSQILDPPLSTSYVLELKACVTLTGSQEPFKQNRMCETLY
jgi:hypothetical protein